MPGANGEPFLETYCNDAILWHFSISFNSNSPLAFYKDTWNSDVFLIKLNRKMWNMYKEWERKHRIVTILSFTNVIVAVLLNRYTLWCGWVSCCVPCYLNKLLPLQQVFFYRFFHQVKWMYLKTIIWSNIPLSLHWWVKIILCTKFCTSWKNHNFVVK